MRPSRLAEGSGGGGNRSMRTEAAFVRAIDASLALDRSIDRAIAVLDDATPPGIVRAPLNEDDSLVLAMRDVVNMQSPVDGDGPDDKNSKMGG